jgi:hypothetical protein
MDCNTARLLNDFHRPRAGDLDPADQAALERHLVLCPECGPRHQAERRLDEAFTRAMTRVDVPDRLREHLHARLEVDRIDRARHRFGHYVRGALIAACLLLALWGGWYAWMVSGKRALPAVDVVAVVEGEKNRARIANNITPDKIEADFRAADYRTPRFPVTLPSDLNYNYLIAEGYAPLPGGRQVVPCLLFANDDTGRHARVYILSARQFDLSNLKPSLNDAYSRKVEVVKSDSGQLAYVAIYNGDNMDWLRLHQDPT